MGRVFCVCRDPSPSRPTGRQTFLAEVRYDAGCLLLATWIRDECGFWADLRSGSIKARMSRLAWRKNV